MKSILISVMLVLTFCLIMPLSAVASPPTATQKSSLVLAKPGQKTPLGSDHYFTYGFTKPPKIGTTIMKVEIFTNDGRQDTSFVVKGDADMPSMRGAHAEGEKKFSLSKKGVYLLPVRLVMLGDWEVSFTFTQNDKTVLRGLHLFDL